LTCDPDRQSTELHNKKGQHTLASIAGAAGLNLFFAFPPPLERFAFLIWPQIMLEAVSMMGEAGYDATDIT
jgi:hypothetical protein